MAIKIKRKRTKEELELEEAAAAQADGEGEDGEGKPIDPIDQLLETDKFIETAEQSLSLVQKHRSTLIGVFAVFAIVIVGIVLWRNQVETNMIEQSAALTDGVKVLEGEVKSAMPDPADEPKPDARKKRTAPKLSFDTEKARDEALLEKADAALAKVDGEAAGPARLMKARALVGLGRAEEAITLYQDWLNANKGAFERPLVLQSLAAAQAQAGKFEDADKTLTDLKGIDEKAYGELASYEQARIYDQAGKKELARERYEAFVKAFPESEKVEWARMRIDTM